MIYVKEEFLFEEVEEYILNNVTIAFVGPRIDERTTAVFNKIEKSIKCVELRYCYDTKRIELVPDGDVLLKRTSDGIDFAKYLIWLKRYGFDYRNVLIDLSSLQGPSIMLLLVALLRNNECKPAKLFTAYARPVKYIFNEDDRYEFSMSYGEAASIPGLVARRREKETLVTFLGFEGARLREVIGDSQYSSVIPVIGFPSDEPKWQFETLKYSKEAIYEQTAQNNIEKCKANSVFDAYLLLEKIVGNSVDNFVIAPIGTKPHLVAATLFVIKNSNRCRLIYDFVEQKKNQTEGVHSIKVSHLSSYL